MSVIHMRDSASDAHPAAGLHVDQARSAAKSIRHYHDMLCEGCSKTIEFLGEVGLVGGPSRLLLRRAHIV